VQVNFLCRKLKLKSTENIGGSTFPLLAATDTHVIRAEPTNAGVEVWSWHYITPLSLLLALVLVLQYIVTFNILPFKVMFKFLLHQRRSLVFRMCKNAFVAIGGAHDAPWALDGWGKGYRSEFPNSNQAPLNF